MTSWLENVSTKRIEDLCKELSIPKPKIGNETKDFLIKYFVTLTSNLIKKVDEQSQTIANLRTRLDKLEEGNESPISFGSFGPSMNINVEADKDTTNTKQKFMNEVVKEQSERNKRKNNIVIVGAKESTKSDAQGKFNDDKAYVDRVFGAIGEDSVKPKSVRRLISKSAMPGVIVVELDNIEERNGVLKAAQKLHKNKDFNKVYVNADLTYNERVLDKQLRTVRNRLNDSMKDNGEFDDSPFEYGIRGGEVVKIDKSNRKVWRQQ
jgi:hypothetical protein